MQNFFNITKTLNFLPTGQQDGGVGGSSEQLQQARDPSATER